MLSVEHKRFVRSEVKRLVCIGAVEICEHRPFFHFSVERGAEKEQ